ncbi:hypothetical protein [Streptomyces sp. NPDC051776]|uniref:hypothetical protein n=1 Tax=Streptomyces sp. NPDC051776 TaxID=3155414 RepID=UPI003414F130
MSVIHRCVSIAAAAGAVAVALTAAQATGGAEPGGPGALAPPEPVGPAPAPTAEPLSFDFGEREPTQSIGTPRAGICYPLGNGSASAFRNNTELSAELHPSPGCGGAPGAAIEPGRKLTGGPPSASVVFSVPSAGPPSSASSGSGPSGSGPSGSGPSSSGRRRNGPSRSGRRR